MRDGARTPASATSKKRKIERMRSTKEDLIPDPSGGDGLGVQVVEAKGEATKGKVESSKGQGGMRRICEISH